MNRGPRVTVAGAGVLGWTTALSLADAGCAVTICDPGGPNASSVAAGMIAPVFEAVLDEMARGQLDLLMAARDLWPGLAGRAGVALDRTGAMAVGGDDWLEAVAAGFGGLQMRPTEIGAATAQGLAPGLAEGFERALLTREDWRVDAPAALSALAQAAKAAGVTYEARSVKGRGDEDVLVVATGAFQGLVDAAPELSKLSPIKGHIVRVAAEGRGAVVRGEGVYAVPGSDTAFGATMEAGVSDPAVEGEKAAPLLAGGLRLFPGLRDAPVQIAAGVRAATPDG
ncbi:MAG: FAD-dependent oxidoreductase, partial [Phenylobacterium sp.]|nr:FAD-dependent oxidoreductase [Phenylobacterium sp.]